MVLIKNIQHGPSAGNMTVLHFSSYKYITGDENVLVRRKAVQFIEEIRENDTSRVTQDFVLPEINANAGHYYNMIYFEKKWGKRYFRAASTHGAAVHRGMQNRLVTEPPLTRTMSSADLHGFILQPMRTDYLCHAQPCERGVKLTSDSCSTKVSYLKHLGLALLTDRGRKEKIDVRALRL